MATPHDRLDAALLASDPAGEIRAGFSAGWLDALVPELRAEMLVPQRTRYHDRSVLDHAIATMAAMPPRLDERLAGLFHDIGKRRTTTLKANGDEQYLGHAPVGARLTWDILLRLGYDEPLVRRVCRLIARHMDLHAAAANGRSAKARAKLLAKVGDDLVVLERLQLADIGAMAPAIATEKRAEALAYHRLLAERGAS